MEVNVDMLEQMDLMDMSDHDALDVFLHSGGEDNSAASPVAGGHDTWTRGSLLFYGASGWRLPSAVSKGPDVESFTAEISLQVPTQAELRHKLSSLSSTCTDSASQDTEAGEEDEEDEEEETERGAGGGRRKKAPVIVTLDEEEIHPDTALVEQAEREGQSSTDCEQSRQTVWGRLDTPTGHDKRLLELERNPPTVPSRLLSLPHDFALRDCRGKFPILTRENRVQLRIPF